MPFPNPETQFKPGNPGRLPMPLDEARIAEMAYEGASVNEIALLIGCDDQTLHNRYSKLIAQNKARRRYDLRCAQTAEAKAGNTALLIWLGKQELEQSDRKDVGVEVTQIRREIGGRPRNPDPGGDAPAG